METYIYIDLQDTKYVTCTELSKTYLNSHNTILPNSVGLVRTLDTTKLYNDVVLMTFDVESLYTNLHVNNSTNAIIQYLKNIDDMNSYQLQPIITHISKLILNHTL